MSTHYFTTRAKAELYDALIDVFSELFKELKELGKKKPDATLSPSKVKIINRVLVDVTHCLEGAANHKYLDLLDDESLPQYSDAILIMAQYEGALRTFRERHYGYRGAGLGEGWFIPEKGTSTS
jgi:hypothetical protein